MATSPSTPMTAANFVRNRNKVATAVEREILEDSLNFFLQLYECHKRTIEQWTSKIEAFKASKTSSDNCFADAIAFLRHLKAHYQQKLIVEKDRQSFYMEIFGLMIAVFHVIFSSGLPSNESSAIPILIEMFLGHNILKYIPLDVDRPLAEFTYRFPKLFAKHTRVKNKFYTAAKAKDSAEFTLSQLTPVLRNLLVNYLIRKYENDLFSRYDQSHYREAVRKLRVESPSRSPSPRSHASPMSTAHGPSVRGGKRGSSTQSSLVSDTSSKLRKVQVP
jgi:DNA-directed RNA polymerase subunit L